MAGRCCSASGKASARLVPISRIRRPITLVAPFLEVGLGQGREELKPRGLEASLGVMERRADAATAFARSRRARPIDRHRPLVSALTGLYRQARQEAQPVIFSRLTQL